MKVSKYENSDFLEKYNKGPVFHKFVGIPAVIEILSDVKNKEILDLGCGSGDFSRFLSEKGAKVVGVDISPKWISICKKKHGGVKNLKFYEADGSDLKQLKNKTFDFAVINMVLLNVPTEEKVKKIFKEVSRVLKESGELIFTDINPASIIITKNDLREYKYSPGFSYFKNGANYKLRVNLENGSKIEFSNKHWTLEAYTNYLREARMYVYKIVEPQPVYNTIIPRDYKIPERIVFLCKKLQ